MESRETAESGRRQRTQHRPEHHADGVVRRRVSLSTVYPQFDHQLRNATRSRGENPYAFVSICVPRRRTRVREHPAVGFRYSIAIFIQPVDEQIHLTTVHGDIRGRAHQLPWSHRDNRRLNVLHSDLGTSPVNDQHMTPGRHPLRQRTIADQRRRYIPTVLSPTVGPPAGVCLE